MAADFTTSYSSYVIVMSGAGRFKVSRATDTLEEITPAMCAAKCGVPETDVAKYAYVVVDDGPAIGPTTTRVVRVTLEQGARWTRLNCAYNEELNRVLDQALGRT